LAFKEINDHKQHSLSKVIVICLLILPWKGLFFVRHNLTIAQFEWITRSLLGIHRGFEIEWMVMTAKKYAFDDVFPGFAGTLSFPPLISVPLQ
jgi:hypothetical protein